MEKGCWDKDLVAKLLRNKNLPMGAVLYISLLYTPSRCEFAGSTALGEAKERANGH